MLSLGHSATALRRRRLLHRPFSALSSAYANLITELYEVNLLQGPVKQGLQNVTALHDVIGKPLDSDSIKTRVHVTGTNGKGSVCLKVARALRWHNEINGVSDGGVGLFVSPHVTSFRERMVVDDCAITEAEVVELLPPILAATREHRIPATFFEILTVLAFEFYKRRGANAVVLECGLGGRLDATNIVQPSVAVVTTVGLDHTRILGNTPELIAREKAGIIKPGVPAVLGPSAQPHSAFFAASEAAGEGSHCVVAPPLSTEALAAGSFAPGDVDAENTAVALETLRVLGVVHPRFDLAQLEDGLGEEGASSRSREGLRTALLSRPSCRFELWQAEAATTKVDGGFSMAPISRLTSADEAPTQGASVILDVAHNPSGIAGLFEKLCWAGGEGGGGGATPGTAGGGAAGAGATGTGAAAAAAAGAGGGGGGGTTAAEGAGTGREAGGRRVSPPLHIVMGMSGDKDLDSCMAAVAEHLDSEHGDRITFVQGTHPRAAEASELAAAFVNNGGTGDVAFQHDGVGGLVPVCKRTRISTLT